MAYNNRRDELQNKIDKLSLTLLGVKISKFVFFLYSFLSFLFWFLNCFELEWLYLFNWLFIVPYRIVGIFYKPTGVTVDFSLALIGIIALVIGVIFEVTSGNLYQSISDAQDELEDYIKQKKEKSIRTRRVPIQSQNESVADSFENPMLLFIIQSQIHKIKTKPNDLELTFQEVESWRQRVNKQILENIQYSRPQQKGYYRKNLFIVYKDFNYVDDFVYYIRPTIDTIIMDFKQYGVDIQFNYVLSSVSQTAAMESELDLMDTILSLSFTGTFILTSKFKQAYEYRTIKRYSLELKGEYNLSKNLAKSNVQPLYVFKIT